MYRFTFGINLLVFLKLMAIYTLCLAGKQLVGWLMTYLLHAENTLAAAQSSWMVYLLKKRSCQGCCSIFISCCKFDGLILFNFGKFILRNFFVFKISWHIFWERQGLIYIVIFFLILYSLEYSAINCPLFIRFSEKFPTTHFFKSSPHLLSNWEFCQNPWKTKI